MDKQSKAAVAKAFRPRPPTPVWTDCPNGAILWSYGGPLIPCRPYTQAQRCPVYKKAARRLVTVAGFATDPVTIPATIRWGGERIKGYLVLRDEGPCFVLRDAGGEYRKAFAALCPNYQWVVAVYGTLGGVFDDAVEKTCRER